MSAYTQKLSSRESAIYFSDRMINTLRVQLQTNTEKETWYTDARRNYGDYMQRLYGKIDGFEAIELREIEQDFYTKLDLL